MFDNMSILMRTDLRRFQQVFRVIRRIFFQSVRSFSFSIFTRINTISRRLRTAPQQFRQLRVQIIRSFIRLTTRLNVSLNSRTISRNLLSQLTIILQLRRLFSRHQRTTLNSIMNFIIQHRTNFNSSTIRGTMFTVLFTLLLYYTDTRYINFLN